MGQYPRGADHAEATLAQPLVCAGGATMDGGLAAADDFGVRKLARRRRAAPGLAKSFLERRDGNGPFGRNRPTLLIALGFSSQSYC
jgi:hypothetical protein